MRKVWLGVFKGKDMGWGQGTRWDTSVGNGGIKGNRFGVNLISMGIKSRILVWGRQSSGVLVEGGKLGSRTLE